MRYCPVCDGFEVIDRVVDVIADDPSGASEALFRRNFIPQISLIFLRPDMALEGDQRRALLELPANLAARPTA